MKESLTLRKRLGLENQPEAYRQPYQGTSVAAIVLGMHAAL